MLKLTENELAALMRQERPRDRTQCLDPETLALLAAGELDERRRGAALDHVATCSDCVEEMQLVAPLRPPARVYRPVFSRATAFAIAASLLLPLLIAVVWQWMEIRELHGTIDNSLATVTPHGDTTSRTETAPPPPDLAPRVAELEAEVRALSQPQLNPAIVDLEPDYLRGGPSSTTIDVPRDAQLFNLILSVAGDATYPQYALEIRDQDGAVLFRGAGLRRSEQGTFSVALPKRAFPAARYEIRIVGIRGAREETLQKYAVDIRYR